MLAGSQASTKMAEFHIGPSPWKAKVDTIATDICVLCPETNDEKLCTPQLSRIGTCTLFDACKARNDEWARSCYNMRAII